MAIQPIIGYPSSWRAPFSAVEIDLGQGPSSAAAQARTAMYVGPMLTTGTWTVGQVYDITNEQDAITGAGPGSPLHRMVRKHLKVNPGGKLSVCPYAASSGAGGVAATATVTFASAPTGNGLARVWVCGELITQGISSSDTVTTIASGVAAKINSKTWLPVTASPSSGVITLTAKILGASQGDGTIGVIRIRADITPGITTTVSTSGAALGLGSGTAGVDGATAENTNLTNALANLTSVRYYYMGFSVWAAAALAIIKTHIANKSNPSPGLRSRSFTGYVSTISNAVTLANAPNFERNHVAWQKNSEHDTAELCAWLMAVTQKYEDVDTANNFDGYSDSEILPAYSAADFASDNDLDTAARNGICAIQSTPNRAFLSMHVTTRSKDSTGAIDDFRATETHRISVMDDFADTVLLNYNLTFKNAGFKLTDDPRNADGTINLNAPIPPKVLTPSRAQSWLCKRIDEFADAAKFQRRAEWKASVRCNIDPLNSSRLEVGASGRTVDLLHQTTFRFSETSPG